MDDTVLDKPYSQEGKTDLVGCFYSGLHGKALKGINLVTLFYADSQGVRVPVNFRAVDKNEGKTKNDLLREMLEEVLAWGLRLLIVTADNWCSGVENLKFLRNKELPFLIALEKNRFRSILIRWAKKPENYLALFHFAAGLIACRAAGLFG